MFTKLQNLCNKIPAWVYLLCILLWGTFVRLWYRKHYPIVPRDGLYYIEQTQAWAEKGMAAIPENLFIKPPLLCYLSRYLVLCGMSAEAAVLAVNMTAGVLLLIPFYRIGKRLFKSRKFGLFCALIASVYHPLVKYSCEPVRESLYLFFISLVFCFWLYAVNSRYSKINALLCGFAAVLSMLCRYEGAEWLVFCGMSLPVMVFFAGSKKWRPAMVSLGCFAAGVLAGVLLIRLLPDMPNLYGIYKSRIMLRCLGTFINPL